MDSLAILLLALTSLLALQIAWGNRQIKRLADVSLSDTNEWPSVAVIIAAKDEANTIEAALETVLNLDYLNYSVTVVNDRSEDETGNVLKAMQAKHPILNIITVDELPPGWMGKNHALWTGATKTSSDWILFTDADIQFAPDTLKKAFSAVLRSTGQRRVDHLAVLPEFIRATWTVDTFIAVFGFFFSLYSRPWLVSNPRSKSHIGIGAFNLVRRSAYEAIGTHSRIPLSVDDDMRLGKLLKQNGFNQAVYNGHGQIRVRWYASFPAMVDGLMKNIYGGLNYNPLWATSGSMFLLMIMVWPYPAALITNGYQAWCYLGICIIYCILLWDNSRFYHTSRWTGIYLPGCTVVFIWMLYRAMWLTYKQQGIIWRGTHYPLSLLKKNLV